MVFTLLKKKIDLYILLLLGFISVWQPVAAQRTAWFADGYHGGIYGHYPMWQAKFMVDQMKENPDWAINLEIEPETWDSVSVKDADNFRAFQEYFEKEGQFGRIEFVNPTWAQPYAYNISGESLIRQFDYGIAKTKEHFPNVTFDTYSAEEPCFTSSLPQILKGFGFKYGVLRNPNTCWGGYTTAFGRDLVNWIGPDGTSMLAVPRYEIEGLSEESTWQTDSWTNSYEFINNCFNDGIRYPIGMCFQDAGWDGGPWHSEYQPTVYTTWTSYIEMIKNRVEPVDWHFTQEDIKPGLVWGAQVIQKIAQEVRFSENRLVMAEKMAAMDYLYNSREWPAEDFAEAWRTLMLAQHHDCWIVPYNGKPGDTWADNVTRWTNSSNLISDVKISNLFGDVSDPDYVRVYNTLGSVRKEQVSIALPDKFKGEDVTVVDAAGNIIPSQVSENGNGITELFFKASVNGMGYNTYKIIDGLSNRGESATESSTNRTIKVDTDYYTAVFDPSKGGVITSLTDKKNGNIELVKQGKYLNNLRGFFYEEGEFLEGIDNRATVSVVDNGPLFTRVKVENHIAGNNYSQFIKFYKDTPLIDFSLHIDWEKQSGIGHYDNSSNYRAEDRNKAFYNDKYKLHLEFHFNEIGERLFKNAPFDVCESVLDNTLYSSWDSIKHNVILNWVDITDKSKKRGVALFSDHATSYLQYEDLPLGLTVQYVGKALWGRDYIIHAPTNINYALFPHEGDWEKGNVQTASDQWNEPLIARFVMESDAASEKSLFNIEGDNLEVSSVVVDDDALIVRFFNTSSDNKPHRVTWNCDVDNIELIDLNGDFVANAHYQKKGDDQLSLLIELPQFGFQTFKLTGVKAI